MSRPREIPSLRALCAALAVFSLSATAVHAGSGVVRPVGSERLLDFCVSIRFDASAAQIAEIERVFTEGSPVLADATDGQARFGRVDLVNDSRGGFEAEVWILPGEGRAYATCGLFGVPGEHVTLYYDSNFGAVPTAEGDAYTIAHEFLHHVWGLKDEYVGPGGDADCEPTPGSPAANFSIMDNYFARGGNDGAGTGSYTLNELCVDSNHDPDLDSWQEAVWGKSCWSRIASHPSFALTPPAGLPVDPAPIVPAPTFRFPLPERRFVVCIDTSSDNPEVYAEGLTFARRAAKIFVDLTRPGDKIAVTSFGALASTDYPLTAIVGETERDAAKAAIEALTASGSTSISAGLNESRDVLAAEPGVACAQTVLLLTDGQENTGAGALSVVPSLVDAGVSVISVAIGEVANLTTLQQLARRTGSRFFHLAGPEQFPDLLTALSAELNGGGTILAVEGEIAQSDSAFVDIPLDILGGDLTVLVSWLSADDQIDVTVTRADGTTITPQDAVNNPNISFLSDETVQGYIIADEEIPDTGDDWSVTLIGNTVDEGSYCLSALSSSDQASIDGAPGQPVVPTGDNIQLLVTPRFRGNNLAGAAVDGRIVAPDGTATPIQLLDNGNPANGDDIAGDGVYGALFGPVTQNGPYNFRAQVVNVDGVTYPGEPLFASIGTPEFTEQAPGFTRVTTGTVVVSGGNSAPTVNCSPAIVLGCDTDKFEIEVEAFVGDLEGDALTVTWAVDGETIQIDEVPAGVGPTNETVVLVTQVFPGIHLVEASVFDGFATDMCGTTVEPADEQAPNLLVELNRTELWPPNHHYVRIKADVDVFDECDPDAPFVLLSIESDEVDCCYNGSDLPNDIKDADFGVPDTEFWLRAERDPQGDGRTYTIRYGAVDESGNTIVVEVAVEVPHDQGGVALSSNGFNADGTTLVESTMTFLLVVDGPHAAEVNAESALLGNTYGVVAPVAAWRQDVTADGTEDLLLEFPAAEVLGLRDLSGPESVGLHYRTVDLGNWLVPDIFGLGAPFPVYNATGAPETGLALRLYRPTPNPFRDRSRIAYAVPAAGTSVSVSIYDVTGRRVRDLVRDRQPAGRQEVEWDGRDGSGRSVPAGVYFTRIQVGGQEKIVRIVRLR